MQRLGKSFRFISPSPNAPKERREAGWVQVNGGPVFPLSLQSASEVGDVKPKVFCDAVQGSPLQHPNDSLHFSSTSKNMYTLKM